MIACTASASPAGAPLAGSVARALAGLARLPGTVWRELSPSGASSPLDAIAGPRRKVEFVSAELAALKRIEHAVSERVTINDIVLSAVAGGLRRWLVHHGASLDGLRVRFR